MLNNFKITRLAVLALSLATIVSCTKDDTDDFTENQIVEETEIDKEQYTFHYNGEIFSDKEGVMTKEQNNILDTASWVVDENNNAYLFNTPEEAEKFEPKNTVGSKAVGQRNINVTFYTNANGTGRSITFRNRSSGNIPGQGNFNNNVRSLRYGQSGDFVRGINTFDFFNQRGSRLSIIGTTGGSNFSRINVKSSSFRTINFI